MCIQWVFLPTLQAHLHGSVQHRARMCWNLIVCVQSNVSMLAHRIRVCALRQVNRCGLDLPVYLLVASISTKMAWDHYERYVSL